MAETETKKLYTLEEFEDKFIGPKGTPKREKYEAEVEKYRRKIIKKSRKHHHEVVKVVGTTPNPAYRGEKEVDYDV